MLYMVIEKYKDKEAVYKSIELEAILGNKGVQQFKAGI